MKEKDLISVIVPVYNVEKYVGKCIESICNQVYKNLEIILVDDGSKDQSLKICSEYAKKDKRIKVIHKKNGGLSSARNLGLDIFTGRYLTFVDSDDFIHSQMIETLYQIMKEEDSDIVICSGQSYEDFTKTEDILKVEDYSLKNYNQHECLKNSHLNFFLTAPKKLYNRLIFEDLRYKNMIHEDVQLAPYIYHKVKKVSYIPIPYYYRYNRSDSITHLKFSEKNYDLLRANEDRITFFKYEQLEDLYKYEYAFLLSNLIFLYYKALNSKAENDMKKIKSLYKKNYKEYVRKIDIKNRIKYFLFYAFPKVTCFLLKVKRKEFGKGM